MKSEIKPRGVLPLIPCNYGLSRVPFRGPMRRTQGRYVACLGGSETFGKFIARPYADLIETAIGEVCVNLGCQSAGPDVFLHDTAVKALCHDAAVTIIQVPGAANLSNRFYKVHPRRNDRFIAPTDMLQRLYPEIDFTEFAFTGHLIAKLQSVDDDRFAQVRAELQATWLRRMKTLIGQCSGPVLLLWLAARRPEDETPGQSQALSEPVFVTRKMLEALRGSVADIVEVVMAHGNTEGMCYAPMEELTAREMMGMDAHMAVARALRGPVQQGLA